MNAFDVGGAGKLATAGFKGLGKLGLDVMPELVGNLAATAASEWADPMMIEWLNGWEKYANGITITASRNYAGQIGIASLLTNPLRGAVSGQLGIKEWQIDGPKTTAKWTGNKGGYYEFGKDNTVWTKDLDNHGGGTQYKVYNKTPKGLKFKTHADQNGQYINRHKGPKGKDIKWSKLKKIF